MLKLRGKTVALKKSAIEPRLLKVTQDPSLPTRIRHQYALLQDVVHLEDIDGFGAVLLRVEAAADDVAQSPASDIYQLGEDYAYLVEGDIVRLNPSQD